MAAPHGAARARIEKVLDFAKARGHRTGENPARWRGHLAALLPKQPRLYRGHFEAMPYVELPAFMTRLRGIDSIGARALEFAILTAARSGEVRGAKWSEIDLAAKVWTIPAARMKARAEHRVPLCERAVTILRQAESLRASDYVFPGFRDGRPLSDYRRTNPLGLSGSRGLGCSLGRTR
jgi:integrase